MTFYRKMYKAYFEHSLELITVDAEQFKANNLALALEQIKREYPNQTLTKLVRLATGQTVWPTLTVPRTT